MLPVGNQYAGYVVKKENHDKAKISVLLSFILSDFSSGYVSKFQDDTSLAWFHIVYFEYLIKEKGRGRL